MSLFFVIATLIEFSIVLFIKRKDEICCRSITTHRRNSFVTKNSESRARPFLSRQKKYITGTNTQNPDCETELMGDKNQETELMDDKNQENHDITDTIDFAAFFVFSCAYILFLSMYMGWYVS